NRYGLNQHSVYEGVSPEGDILPQRLQEIIKLSRELNIDTIYAEDLIDPRLANVIATEISNGKVLIKSNRGVLTKKTKKQAEDILTRCDKILRI
ncbi:MAG TPA: zinc ABC transporter substrate-binding protein, partial [Nitrososphaeraceae archaeon]|nr:zinc ABC transporter substrate-binding protein [Nitrososphaeraceae archaeon]